MEYPLLLHSVVTRPGGEVKMSGWCVESLVTLCLCTVWSWSMEDIIKTNFPPSLPLCAAICHNGGIRGNSSELHAIVLQSN